ncbi:MAG: hypothetical protein ACRDF0_09660 [Candidatus Limnocylindria bacterium]
MRRVLTIGLAIIALTFAGSSPAAADGECRQTAHATLTAASDEGTRGDFMSDVIFGNEPNIVDPFAPGGPEEQDPGTVGGRVVSSQSPGPFVNEGFNEPPRDDRGEHGFGGDDLAAALNTACN